MNKAKIKSTLLSALKTAGRLLKTSISKRQTIHKKSELSLVTAIDKAAEVKIIQIIKKNFPEHSILAEESAPQGKSPYRWIIDPLDGTTNFAHGYPVACVSIGFEADGTILLGGVYDPFRNELFFAEHKKGATLNGKRIRVSSTPKLSDSLVATGFPYDRREHIDDYLGIARAFLMKVQCIRRAGAAAIDLCYVACGRFDGYWEVNLQPWDKAAGALIVREAGGRLSNFSGKPLTLSDSQNVASNGKIHSQMLELVKPFQHVGRY